MRMAGGSILRRDDFLFVLTDSKQGKQVEEVKVWENREKRENIANETNIANNEKQLW